MNPIKKMIIEETVNALREVKHKKKIKEITGELYEAVRIAGMVKNNPTKHKVAKRVIHSAEQLLFKELRKVNENHEYEGEGKMAKAQLLAIMEKANELYHMIDEGMQLEDWVQYKLSIAENYMDAVHGYMKYYNGVEDMEHEVDDEMEWEEVEEEDFDDADDIEYDDEDGWDETNIDDFEDFGDEEEYYDEEDFDEFDEEGI
jgi:hypothetical protein